MKPQDPEEVATKERRRNSYRIHSMFRSENWLKYNACRTNNNNKKNTTTKLRNTGEMSPHIFKLTTAVNKYMMWLVSFSLHPAIITFCSFPVLSWKLLEQVSVWSDSKTHQNKFRDHWLAKESSEFIGVSNYSEEYVWVVYGVCNPQNLYEEFLLNSI